MAYRIPKISRKYLKFFTRIKILSSLVANTDFYRSLLSPHNTIKVLSGYIVSEFSSTIFIPKSVFLARSLTMLPL